MGELEMVQNAAWDVLTGQRRTPRVILQIGYLIDYATSVKEVMKAMSLIGEFEIEEAAAEEEALLNQGFSARLEM